MTWSVLKFGGSSVADANLWKTIQREVQVKLDQGHQPFLVLSALKNVSNLLEALLHQALAGVHIKAIFQLKELHLRFAAELGVNGETALQSYFDDLTDFCDEIYRQQTVTPKQHAQVLACGELFSTVIGANYLQNQGVNVFWMDCRAHLIAHNNRDLDEWHHYTSNQCDYSESLDAKRMGCQSDQVIITQGFIAADEFGDTVLLGREGSDTSASYFAAKLRANQLEIWTDVPGVFSINPRDISEARQLSVMSYRQAELFSQSGAKVLHPRAMAPVKEFSIPVRVKSTRLPENPGTYIYLDDCAASVIGIAIEESVTWVRANHLSQTTIEQLLALGFDRIELDLSNANQCLLLYRHTEKHQPEDDQLSHKYSVMLESGYTLITLLGSTHDGQWIEDVKAHMSSQWKERTLACFTNKELGIMSILVNPNCSAEITQQLHRGLIEENELSNEFGLSWSSIVSES